MQKYVTSRERVWRAVLREPNDVVPVGPFAGFYAARITEVPVRQYVTDGRVIAAAQHWLWHKLDHDNLDPAGALLRGSEAEAREQAERCLAEAGPGGGFILGTGCFVAWDTPLENLKTMVRAVRDKRTSFHVPSSATFRVRTGGIGPGTGPVHPKFIDQPEKPAGE